MTAIAQELSQVVGVTRACHALEIPRSRLYPRHASAPTARPTPKHALSAEERAKVRAVCHDATYWANKYMGTYAQLMPDRGSQGAMREAKKSALPDRATEQR